VLGGWSAEVAEGRLTVTGAGAAGDWWRVVASAAWRHVDRGGAVPDLDGLAPPREG
jgi:glycerol 3-phosphatase-2